MDKPCNQARRGAALALASLLAVAGGYPAAAQTVVPTLVVDVPAEPELVIEDGSIQLLLEDAIVLALRRNLNLSVERYGHQQALTDLVGSRGIYDLRLQANASIDDSESPTLSELVGVPVEESNFRNYGLSLSQLTPFGGQATLSFNGNRQATNDVSQRFNPSFSSGGDFSFIQPLLRNFGRLATERPIIQARLAAGQSREFFEQQVTNLLVDVENAYWDLVEAREQLNVAEQSLELARQLHDRNLIQVEVGTLAPIELVQSEATIATREEGIITAQAQLGDAADRLLQLLNLPRAMAEGLEVQPRTAPETTPISIDLQQAIATALAERPEVQQQQLAVERLEVESKFFRNQKLPVADLDLGYGANALASPALGTDLIDALADVLGRDFTGWNVGVVVGMPLQNRGARAQSAVADLDLERGRTQLDQLELDVTTDVRAAARQVRTAEQQIASAQASVRLQERNLEAEQRRYENGMSTGFRVTEIQEDLTAARSRLVSAITSYRRALTAYHRSTGRLLEESGVELAGPVEVELPARTFGDLFR